MNVGVTSKIDIDVEKIAKAHHLDGKKLGKFIGETVHSFASDYTPKNVGTLDNTGQVQERGNGIVLVYNQPYAHYQWEGLVMGPNVLTKNGWRSLAKKGGKYYTGASIRYQGEPRRGPRWTERMMQERRADVLAAVAKKVGGKVK